MDASLDVGMARSWPANSTPDDSDLTADSNMVTADDTNATADGSDGS